MKAISLVRPLLAAGIFACSVAACVGQSTNLLLVPATAPTRDTYTGCVGCSFKVGSSNIVISHLGYYSTNSPTISTTGLNSNHNVGVFVGGATSSPGNPYGQVVVPMGTNALWVSNYYWVALNPPIILASNSTYTLVGLAYNGDGDSWHDLYNPGWNPVFVGGTGTTSGGNGIYGPGNATWPPTSTGNNGANNCYGAPNMANIPVGPAYAGVQSTNISISAGQTLKVVGFGTGQQPITYQWYLGSVSDPLGGQTNATLSIPNSTTGNSGTYFMIASNALGSEQTSNVTVTVSAVPVSITQQPSNATVYANYPVTFSIAASGTPPISYQWSRNGVAISGATGTSYSLYASISNNGDIYTCMVSNNISLTPHTQTSSNAMLTVNYNLAYPQEFLHGYNTTLSVNSYTGQVGGHFTTGNTPEWVTYLGYYAWPAATTTNGSSVTCVLTNSSHYVGIYTANGQTLLASTDIPQGTNPVINGYMWQPLPSPMLLAPNTEYLLDAQTFGNEDPWGNVYSLPDLNSYFASSCDAVYGGAGWGGPASVNGDFSGDMYSAPNMAILANPTPDAWAMPEEGITTNAGFTETLTGVVGGQPPVLAQWYFQAANQTNIVALLNQTNLTLTLTNADTTSSGNYYVLATNPITGSNTLSAPVAVTINPDVAPQLSQDISPQSPTVVQGSTISFSASFYGSPTFTYGWEFNYSSPITNSARISGANGPVLTIADVQPNDAGTYQLFATNAEGVGESSPSTMAVVPLVPFNGGVGWSYQGTTVFWQNTNVLELTQGVGDETNSAFCSSPVYIGGFKAGFTYQCSGSGTLANGVTFCIQNDPRGAAALGGVGGGGSALGIGTPNPIIPSVELEINIYTNNGIGGAGISFDTNGAIGRVVSPTNVLVNSGDPISTVVTYINGVLTATITDTVSNTTFSMSTNINIPALLGTNNAYVGFTGADGASSSTQQISNFSFASLPQLSVQATGGNLVLTWPASIGNFTLMQAANLTSPNWTPVAVPAQYNGSGMQAVIPISGAAAFYQLEVTNVPAF